MMHITIEKEKLEQWLEDLEYSDSDKNVIAAIKQALAAQPAVQEPVSPEDHLMGEAHKYWKHANARHHGAVQWIENNETGELLIYTRGEYRDTLMANITNTTPPAAPVQPDYKQLYEQVCEQYDVLAKELEATKQALAAPIVQEPVVFFRCNGCGHAYEQVHPTSCDCMEAGGFERVEYYTNPPAAQRQCNWPTCQSEEYQQSLAEQIKQELVTGAAQPSPVQEPVGTYGEIYESMQSLLRSGLQSDQQIYAAMKDKPLYTTPSAAKRRIEELEAQLMQMQVLPWHLNLKKSNQTQENT